MEIEKININGFRNYSSASINFDYKTLVIGANDSGKTNLIQSMRLLLDKSLSENDLEPCETDFHIDKDGNQADELSIEIHFKNIKAEAVISILKGCISNQRSTIFKYKANRSNLSYSIECGPTQELLTEVNNRFYLRHVNLKYVKSSRDLEKFVGSEKRSLLKTSQERRSEEESEQDQRQLEKISRGLSAVNRRVSRLHYVANATSIINDELMKLSHDLTSYTVHLDSGAIKTQQFIDNLKLAASTSGSKISLGGDGRNNQILMALWKAKSQRDYDPDSEAIFYCIEEPEAHLHPHQQRKLADYLIQDLPGQTIITTHSPQIVARYSPESIVNIISSETGSYAASGGCSKCIHHEWNNLGYRMSILPAEAFFSKCVLLVEGPSELLFYHELAKQIKIDLDYYNISILCVDGVQFKVYAKILDAMQIPWVMRTDNDISKITVDDIELKQLAGINRCLELAKLDKLKHMSFNTDHKQIMDSGIWHDVSSRINPCGVYIAIVDLETDLFNEYPNELKAFGNTQADKTAIAFMQDKKATRMREFLHLYGYCLATASEGELAKPIKHCRAKVLGDIL